MSSFLVVASSSVTVCEGVYGYLVKRFDACNSNYLGA